MMAACVFFCCSLLLLPSAAGLAISSTSFVSDKNTVSLPASLHRPRTSCHHLISYSPSSPPIDKQNESRRAMRQLNVNPLFSVRCFCSAPDPPGLAMSLGKGKGWKLISPAIRRGSICVSLEKGIHSSAHLRWG